MKSEYRTISFFFSRLFFSSKRYGFYKLQDPVAKSIYKNYIIINLSLWTMLHSFNCFPLSHFPHSPFRSFFFPIFKDKDQGWMFFILEIRKRKQQCTVIVLRFVTVYKSIVRLKEKEKKNSKEVQSILTEISAWKSFAPMNRSRHSGINDFAQD